MFATPTTVEVDVRAPRLGEASNGGNTMLRKATIAAVICAVALVVGTAGAAFAGEVTGNGKPTQGFANAMVSSRCLLPTRRLSGNR